MQSTEHSAIGFSVRVYRLLLLLCPSAFRRQYGALRVQAFRDTCRDARRQHGPSGVLLVWPAAFSDVLATALAEGGDRRHTASHHLGCALDPARPAAVVRCAATCNRAAACGGMRARNVAGR